MSFTCTKHGWQHLLSACPACTSGLVGHSVVTHDSRQHTIGELQAAIESWKREETMWREQEIELKQQLAEAVEVLTEISCLKYGWAANEKARAFLQKIGGVK